MNFLGHLFLSGNDPLVITGNFMADAVKGRDFSRFHPQVQAGIRLHRAIDSFTDNHPAQSLGRQRLREHAGRYAGVVMDLLYDHLLAREWRRWHPEELDAFAARMYKLLQANMELLPEPTRYMLPYMVKGDWLTSYATIEGIGRALSGLSRRAVDGGRMAGSEQVLVEHLSDFQHEFDVFLPDIIAHTAPFR